METFNSENEPDHIPYNEERSMIDNHCIVNKD